MSKPRRKRKPNTQARNRFNGKVYSVNINEIHNSTEHIRQFIINHKYQVDYHNYSPLFSFIKDITSNCDSAKKHIEKVDGYISSIFGWIIRIYNIDRNAAIHIYNECMKAGLDNMLIDKSKQIEADKLLFPESTVTTNREIDLTNS